jgi:hypothetical protein
MKIHQLRNLCAVARTGSFTRASVDEGVAQPSLSQQIVKLEKTLGAKLFDRLSRAGAVDRIRADAAAQSANYSARGERSAECPAISAARRKRARIRGLHLHAHALLSGPAAISLANPSGWRWGRRIAWPIARRCTYRICAGRKSCS